MGLSIVAIGIGVFSYGVWLYSNAVSFVCDDTPMRRAPVPAASALCEAPETWADKMIAAAFIGLIGSVLLFLNKYTRPVAAK